MLGPARADMPHRALLIAANGYAAPIVFAMFQITLAQAPTQPPAPAPAADAAPKSSLSGAMNDPLATLSGLAKEIGKLLVTWGPSVLGALLILFIAWVFAGWIRKHIIHALERAKIDRTLSKFFANLAKWTIVIFALITAAGIMGIPTASFAAIIGAAGLAIGLALQGNLGNLASGVLLLIFRPFKLGDAVIIAGQAGTVDGIDLFTTNLDTADNRRIIVPNGQIFGGVIENQSHHPHRLISVRMTIRGDAEIEPARATLLAAAQGVVQRHAGAIKDKSPDVSLAELAGGQAWNIAVWAQTSKAAAVREALLIACKESIDQKGLGVPPPTSVVINK